MAPRFLRYFLGTVIAFAPLSRTVAQQAPGLDFKGKLLVGVSDTDMLPSAYLDGKLGPPAGADQLSVIRLDRPASHLRAASVPVSNSVAGPPACVAVTPDGHYAIAIETFAPRRDNAPEAKLADLADGRLVTVVDLADPDHPRVAQQVAGFERPLAVSINFDGSLVAIAYGAPDRHATPGIQHPPLALYRFANGRLSAPVVPAIPGFGAAPHPDDELIGVEFHPHRNLLALVYFKNPRLSLVEVKQDLTLSRWGNDVEIDRQSFLARFTADGRFVLTNAMFYNSDIRGTVTSTQLGATTAPDGTPHHAVVSRVEAGPAPEGLAVSPDGRWVATTNLERSAYPLDDPRQGFFSSVTLLRMDPATGMLERVGEFPFEGMLPEAPVFDNSSRFLAVTNFAFFDASTHPGGSIDIWHIAGDYADPRRVELVKTTTSIPVARGPQSIAIVR